MDEKIRKAIEEDGLHIIHDSVDYGLLITVNGRPKLRVVPRRIFCSGLSENEVKAIESLKKK
jgi:hypothetical protein